jgi:hypothetical protein
MRLQFGALVLVIASTGVTASNVAASGLRPGDEVSAWEPIHVAGPHAGTKACPVCTYLDAPVLLAFVKDVKSAEPLAKTLEEIAAAHRKGRLKVLLVVIDGSDIQLQRFAKDQSILHVMLCRVDPERRREQLDAYKIDPAASSTVMLYRDYLVTKTWTAIGPRDLAQLKKVTEAYPPKR